MLGENHIMARPSRQLLWMLFSVLCLIPPVGHTDARLEQVYTKMLMGDDPKAIKLAVKGLYYDADYSVEMGSIAAELLNQRCTGDHALHGDTIAWLGKALGQSRSARYLGVVERCLAQTEERRVKKHLAKVIKVLDEPADSYVAGSMDLEFERSKIETTIESDQENYDGSRILSITTGMPIQEVLEVTGLPTHARLHVERHAGIPRRYGIRDIIRVRKLLLEYGDVGAIVFMREGNDVTTLQAQFALAYIDPADEELKSIQYSVATNQPVELREAVKQMLESGERRHVVLDLIANKLYLEMDQDEHYWVDAMAWMSKLMQQAADSRYRSLMSEVAQRAKHPKVRRHAQEAVTSIPDADIPQHSVSNEAD